MITKKIKLLEDLFFANTDEIATFNWFDNKGNEISLKEILNLLNENNLIDGKEIILKQGIYNIYINSSDWEIEYSGIIFNFEPKLNNQIDYILLN